MGATHLNGDCQHSYDLSMGAVPVLVFLLVAQSGLRSLCRESVWARGDETGRTQFDRPRAWAIDDASIRRVSPRSRNQQGQALLFVAVLLAITCVTEAMHVSVSDVSDARRVWAR